jgi:hypothetical protein
MRWFKRWYRLQLYLLGRWLTRRYQKPIVFGDPGCNISPEAQEIIGNIMADMAGAKSRGVLRKVSRRRMERIIEEQPT